jgi:BirA family biotin operon repressor/biotin-[acetyl-CoA-carboxylase] ligase
MPSSGASPGAGRARARSSSPRDRLRAGADAVKDFRAHPGIKRPNDILIGGKKVGGSLVECGFRGDQIDHVIVGLGVNLNVERAVLRAALGRAGGFATSLAAETGHEIDRNAFAATCLNHLDTWAQAWETLGPGAILAAWQMRDILTGRRVEVRWNGPTYEGRVLGLDTNGSLLVQDTLGHRHALTSEEVRILD